MSEEILKALMHLFGLIAKQDGGVESNESEYVLTFLKQQLSADAVEEYYSLFKLHSTDKSAKEGDDDGKVQLTSMKDSVKIIGICKKINKQLNKEQKAVVLVRLYELVNADGKFTDQRMGIINTVADVFNFPKAEVAEVESYVLFNDPEKLNFSDLLVIDNEDQAGISNYHIKSQSLDGKILILKVSSAGLYFLRYTGNQEIFLNGLLLSNQRIYLFPKGSFVKLPKGKPVYYTDVISHFLTDESTPKVSYVVNNLKYQFKNGTIGLRDINIAEEQGKLIGIMGASGAGKTTLLNVLCGNEVPSEGEVLINGFNLHAGVPELEGVIGYIPQDDLLIEELTVFENLYYNAKLCFKDKSEEDINGLVEETLSSLGLWERRALKVGSPLNKMISGGQRKRLNIALELIRQPAILFVDEPTSGLSSRDSENVMNLLRELTLKGKLIFVVIHQPSSDIYKMFDKMYILDTGGFPAYYGNPSESLIYFKRLDAQINSDQGECPTCGNLNPELIFNILDANVIDEYGNYTKKRKTTPEEWYGYYKKNIVIPTVKQVEAAPPRTLNIPAWFKQFQIYTIRDFFSKISNTQYILLNVLEAPILAFILAYLIRYIVDPLNEHYIFRQNENVPPYIFMGIIVALFFGLIISAEEIFKDAKILKREAFLNLSRSSYLASKIVILFSISAIQMALFVLVGNYVIGFKGMSFEFWLMLFSVMAFSNILGLIISASFNSIITIYILIPLLIIPQMVLGGAMFTFDKLNKDFTSVDKVPFVAELMPSRWAYEGLMVNQFKNNNFKKDRFDLELKQSKADYMQSLYKDELLEVIAKTKDYLEAPLEGDKVAFESDVALINYEVHRQMILLPVISCDFTSELTPDKYNLSTVEKVDGYVEQLREVYADEFTRAFTAIDKIDNWFMDNDRERYLSIKDQYFNESVNDIVRKVYEKNKILRDGNRFVQTVEPIYQIPEPKHVFDFRTHFFAPKKHFLGIYFETLWFNITIIWLFTIILYGVLYYDLLLRLLNFLSDIKLFKKKS